MRPASCFYLLGFGLVCFLNGLVLILSLPVFSFFFERFFLSGKPRKS